MLGRVCYSRLKKHSSHQEVIGHNPFTVKGGKNNYGIYFRTRIGIYCVPTRTEYDAVSTNVVCIVLLHAVPAGYWKSGT